MTFTHVGDVSAADQWSEEDLGQIFEDEEEAYAVDDDDEDDLWLEEEPDL